VGGGCEEGWRGGGGGGGGVVLNSLESRYIQTIVPAENSVELQGSRPY